MMTVACLADTHIPKRARDLPLQAYQYLERADAIVHAGDALTSEFLDQLRQLAPVYAVLGNNDDGLALATHLELTWEGVAIGVVHNSGARTGRVRRLRKLFPRAAVVIFGHSHVPVNETHDGLLLFNPGSPTDKRRQPTRTMGLLSLQDGGARGQIVELA